VCYLTSSKGAAEVGSDTMVADAAGVAVKLGYYVREYRKAHKSYLSRVETGQAVVWYTLRKVDAI